MRSSSDHATTSCSSGTVATKITLASLSPSFLPQTCFERLCLTFSFVISGTAVYYCYSRVASMSHFKPHVQFVFLI